MKLAVVGGTGFVGSRVLRAALSHGMRVASVTRSGTPPPDVAEALRGVSWLAADAQDERALESALVGADAVISCVGAFGSNAYMRRINGNANASIAAAARAAGASQFVYVSAAQFGAVERLPPLRGYFEGKRAAEEAVGKHFAASGTVLRPGMVYGSRRLSARVSLPLGLAGAPLAALFGSGPVRALAAALGPIGGVLVPPVHVDALAAAAIDAARGALPPDPSNSAVAADGADEGGGGDGDGARVIEVDEIDSIAAASADRKQVTLFWDGGCPLCAREIRHYQRLDTEGRVCWVDIHARPAALSEYPGAAGVTAEAAMARIHAIDADGELRIGVRAFMTVWDALPYWRVLPPLLRSVPGAIDLAHVAYEAFAKRRLRLTGRARACDGPDCDDQAPLR